MRTGKIGKRALSVCLALALWVLTACGTGTEPGTAGGTGREPGEGRTQIVATIFPAWDWVRQILGDRADSVDLTLLMDSGVDLHSYQPSVDDMVKISSCDVFVCVGGPSDQWVTEALESAENPRRVVVNLLDALGEAVKEEETVEGMEPEADGLESHGTEAGRDGLESHRTDGPEYDEHVWLSLRNAAALCEVLASALGDADPAHRDLYTANAAAYAEKLNALDAQYVQTVDAAPCHTILFGDRFPFRYLADDYGLTYYAAFPGCSAETEASFETIVFLAGKVDELGLDAVLTTETADGRIARTIVENTAEKSARILTLDSMQSVTAREIGEGVTYLDVMERNLDTLRQALNVP